MMENTEGTLIVAGVAQAFHLPEITTMMGVLVICVVCKGREPRTRAPLGFARPATPPSHGCR
jgi:hypothetical protein